MLFRAAAINEGIAFVLAGKSKVWTGLDALIDRARDAGPRLWISPWERARTEWNLRELNGSFEDLPNKPQLEELFLIATAELLNQQLQHKTNDLDLQFLHYTEASDRFAQKCHELAERIKPEEPRRIDVADVSSLRQALSTLCDFLGSMCLTDVGDAKVTKQQRESAIGSFYILKNQFPAVHDLAKNRNGKMIPYKLIKDWEKLLAELDEDYSWSNDSEFGEVRKRHVVMASKLVNDLVSCDENAPADGERLFPSGIPASDDRVISLIRRLDSSRTHENTDASIALDVYGGDKKAAEGGLKAVRKLKSDGKTTLIGRNDWSLITPRQSAP